MQVKMLKMAVAAFAVFGLGACSTAGQSAPFHIYNSPLLNAEYHPSQRRDREFDPLEIGDHVEPETVYAINHAPVVTKVKAQNAKPAPQKKTNAKRKSASPTLSTTAHRVGGLAEKNSGTAAKNESSPAAHAAEYVWEVYKTNGLELSKKAQTKIPALYKECKKVGRIHHAGTPRVGDIIFFHNVYDANGDKRNNDWYTHVAIVDEVTKNDVTGLGYRHQKLEKIAINLEKPDEVGDSGSINSRLREPSSDDAPFTQYYSSQLFAGYCSALGDKKEFIAVDGWSPGATIPNTK